MHWAPFWASFRDGNYKCSRKKKGKTAVNLYQLPKLGRRVRFPLPALNSRRGAVGWTALFSCSGIWFYAACAATDVGFVGFGRIDAGVYAWEKGLILGDFWAPFRDFTRVFFEGTGYIPGGTGGFESPKGLRNYAERVAYMQIMRFWHIFRHEIILLHRWKCFSAEHVESSV